MQNTQINSHLNNETILTKKDNTILINVIKNNIKYFLINKTIST
jgi:hypothetical protein